MRVVLQAEVRGVSGADLVLLGGGGKGGYDLPTRRLSDKCIMLKIVKSCIGKYDSEQWKEMGHKVQRIEISPGVQHPSSCSSSCF